MSEFYDGWHSEVSRLESMDAALTPTAQADLTPTLANYPGGKLLDIGAGTGVTVRDLCNEMGVEYTALDRDPVLLAARSEDDSHKILADNTAIPRPDNSFQITFARAVHGWGKNPKESIAEQLRVTDHEGGVAILTDFDWNAAQVSEEADPADKALLENIKTRLLGGLALAGFKAFYGAQLGKDIDDVMQEKNIKGVRKETPHTFPQDDHRGLLTDAATSFLERVGEKFNPLPDEMKKLQDDVDTLKALPHKLSFTIPTLFTHHVTLTRND